MDINIKAIHFDATEKLEAFIEKKVSKLAKVGDNVRLAEVTLKVVKPETSMNKYVSIRVMGKGEFYAEKIKDTFEEAVLETVEAIERQIAKTKEKIDENERK